MAARTTLRNTGSLRGGSTRSRVVDVPLPGGGVVDRARRSAKAKGNARVAAPPTVANRVLALTVLLCLGYVGLAARLAYLQIYRHPALVKDARELRARAIRLPARRGELLDRNGALLVRNEPAFAIALDPNPWFVQPNPKTDDTPENRQRRAIEGLKRHLPEVDVAGIVATRGVNKGSSGRYRTIEIAPVVSLGVGKLIKEENLPGVSVQPTARRVAIDGELASHVLGYTRRDGVGAAGIEYALDNTLTGAPGRLEAEFDPRRRPIPGTVKEDRPALDGKDLVLTLDTDLQHTVQEALEKAFLKSRASWATAVVLDPATGDILALANYPDYDVNRRKAPVKAWQNLAVSAPFEPGSTLKAITAAAALEERKVQPNTPFYCAGQKQIGKKFIHCHGGERHGTMDLTGVIKHSCNVATAECAFEVGKTRLYDYLRLFGFGEKTGSGLPGESRGILPSPSRWADMRLANIAFGQGISVTALQLAAAYSAIANDGVWLPPRIVRGARNDNGTIEDFALAPGKRVLSANNARELRRMLQSVVEEGTGTNARLNGYTAAGKTGTAQIAENGRYRGKHLASFIGMAPVEKPRFVILVSVNDPKGEYYGGQVAAPVFREIAEKALVASRVPRDPAALARGKGKAGSSRD